MDWILLAQDMAVAAEGKQHGGEQLAWLDAIEHALMTPAAHIVICAVLFAAGVYLLVPPRGRGKQFLCGGVLAALAVVLFLFPTLQHLPAAPAFLLLEGLAVLGGLGTITSRSPVYSAIWFASSLLAIGALLLMNGAQFLGLATVAVYAGAIVVTFLFVLMLAQPEGHAVYDRIGWGWFPALCAAIGGSSMVAIVSVGLFVGGQPTDTAALVLQKQVAKAIVDRAKQARANQPRANQERPGVADRVSLADAVTEASILDAEIRPQANGGTILEVTLVPGSGLLERGEAVFATAIRSALADQGSSAIDPSTQIRIREQDILATDHVARLGGELFGRHLISIQVAAVLLLVALVGAISMAIHGKDLAAGQVVGKAVQHE